MGFWKKDINLVPEKQAKENKKRTAVFYTRLGLLVIIFLCVVNLVFQGIAFGYLTYVNNMAKNEIERLAPIRDKDADVKLKTGYIDKRTVQLAGIRKGDVQIVQYIEALEKVLPVDFAAKEITMNWMGEINISGTVPNELIAADVAVVLRESGLVPNAELTKLLMDNKGTRTEFSIKGTMGKI